MQNSFIAGTSIMAVQGVSQIPTDGTPVVDIIKIAVQLIIGVGALLQFFKKKPKEVVSNQNSESLTTNK